MKLKKEDRSLLHEFFVSQSDWMKSNSLLTSENLKEFNKRFLDFEKSKDCEENVACQLFQLTLDHELIRCEERKLMMAYNAEQTGLKKVKLNYMSVIHMATDNSTILLWINEANLAYEVSNSHMQALDQCIGEKLEQNRLERTTSYE